MLRSTQPSTLHGTVKEYRLTDCVIITVAMVDVDGSCQFSADSQLRSIGLMWVLAATRRSVCIHQMNRVNSRNDFGHDDSTINIVVVIIVITIFDPGTQFPGRAWSSSPACTWHCSVHYLFLQATPLFPHGVTIVC